MSALRALSVPRGAAPLPGDAYTSEAIFRQEAERIFARQWVCVGHASQLAHPGDYLLAEVAGERLLLVRGEDGAARAFYNLCRHRGMPLCAAERGHFSETIQCPYHAWTYGLDGRLLAARQMRQVAGFDAAGLALCAAAAAEWQGLLFASLAPARPLEQLLAPLGERCAAWQLGGLRPAARVDYEVRANWKVVLENFSECYHCPTVHPALDAAYAATYAAVELGDGPFVGAATPLVRGASAIPALAGLDEEQRGHGYFYTVLPNLMLSLLPNHALVYLLRPLDAGRTLVSCEWLFEPQTIARPGFSPAGLVALWDQINREDWPICEQMQQGLASRAYRPGPYAHAEELLWRLDQAYLAWMGDAG